MPELARLLPQNCSGGVCRAEPRHAIGFVAAALIPAALTLAALAGACIAGAKPEGSSAADRTAPSKLRGAADQWPLFRGNPASTGVAAGPLANELKVLWKRSFKDGAIEATATIVDGTVYVGSFDGNLYALDLATGKEKWKFYTELGFRAAAAVRDGMVYIGDSDGVFYALDAATGAEKWRFATHAEIDTGANFYQDTVLFTSQDGSLYCRKADSGDKVWKYTTGDMIRCAPTVVENRCFVAGCDSKFHIVDLDTGQAVATMPIEDGQTNCTPAVAGDRAFFGTHAGKLLCVDWRLAQPVWRYDPQGAKPIQTSPAVAAGLVVFGGQDRLVHALDAATGTESWSFPARANVDSSPVVAGERVFVGAGNGRLYGLDLKTGEKVWEYEAGGSILASPAVAAGRLVIGSDSGDLYCFGAK